MESSWDCLLLRTSHHHDQGYMLIGHFGRTKWCTSLDFFGSHAYHVHAEDSAKAEENGCGVDKHVEFIHCASSFFSSMRGQIGE